MREPELLSGTRLSRVTSQCCHGGRWTVARDSSLTPQDSATDKNGTSGQTGLHRRRDALKPTA